MTSIGTRLFVFGGCDAGGRCSDLHSFDSTTRTWTQMPTSPSISGRGGPALAASHDGMTLYAACGYSGEENDDVHAFDVKTNTWRVCVAPGSGLFSARSVVGSCKLPASLGGAIAVFGGETESSAKGHDGAGNFTNDVVIIDSVTGDVSVAAAAGDAAPCVRGWTCMAAWEEQSGEGGAVVFGGLTGDDDAPLRLGDTWLMRLMA